MTHNYYSELPVFHFASRIKRDIAKHKLRCLIFGNFGAGNLGDEAILQGQLAELSQIQNLTVAVCARFPKEVRRIHSVRGISIFALGSILRELRRSDFVIVGGGGIICKADRGLIGWVYQLYTLLLFFYLPKLYQRKIYVIGLGFYQNANPYLRSTSANCMKSAQIVSVRDRHSLNTIIKADVKAKLYKDNSYLMQLIPKNEVQALPFIEQAYKSRRAHVGFALKNPASDADEKTLTRQILRFVDKTRGFSDFWFFPCDYHKSYKNDVVYAKKLIKLIHRKYKKKVNVSMIPTEIGPQQFFSSLALMDFTVNMRFHAAVFSDRLQVPYVGIPYDEKVSSFLKSTGAPVMSLSEFSEKKLTGYFMRSNKKIARLFASANRV